MSSHADRLKALREQLKADRLDGFVVPLTDEHMSEYVGLELFAKGGKAVGMGRHKNSIRP